MERLGLRNKGRGPTLKRWAWGRHLEISLGKENVG